MLLQILDLGEAKPREQVAVLQTLFGYLFRDINKYRYRERMPSREYAKALWSRVSGTAYVLRNCKLYVYARFCAQREGRRISAAKFGIAPEDLKLLNAIEIKVNGRYTALTLEEFEDLERWVLTSPQAGLDAHMGRFISKKLIFLCRHYGLTRDQIQNEFLETSLYALRKQYPFFKSELHTVNICKTAIHNAGISLINYWTRGKRNALQAVGDGTFNAVHVDMDVAQSLNSTLLGVVAPQDDPHQQNLQALREATSKVGPRARLFLSLAQGTPDAGFSLFLGTSNDDAVHEWAYTKYLASLCSYLHVSTTEAQRLMTYLRTRV